MGNVSMQDVLGGKDSGEEFYSFEAPEQHLMNVNMLNQSKFSMKI